MVEIFMPKAGMDMKEGRLIRWLKEVGDPVEQDEPIMEIETDKIVMEAEAPGSGILLAKLVDDDTTVPVLQTIGYIGMPGEKIPSPEKQSVIGKTTERDAATPAVPGSGQNYDVAVIGGGPAGYVAAIRAAQLGGNVILFEKDVVGGTCLNRGCIPTKTYLKTAEVIREIQNAKRRGIVCGSAEVDMPQAVAYKDRVVRQLTDGVKGLLRANHVTVIQGEAALVDEHTVRCAEHLYRAKSIILCGGSRPVRIPIPGIDHPAVLTSTEILDLKEVPKRLVIIGGGVIGCEMASAFRAFGSSVSIIEGTQRLIPIMDRELSVSLEKVMTQQGVAVYTGKKVAEIRSAPNGVALICEDGTALEADKILLSVGRSAELECLGEMKDRIRVEQGKVVVDDAMRTNVPNIYAAGDINGRLMLAHAAFQMGKVAAENAVGRSATCDLSVVPSCVYTIPQAASVGMTEDEAVSKFGREELEIGVFPLSANGRALSCGETEGYVKVIMRKKYQEFCGVHIFGAQACEMIAEPAVLMASEITVAEVDSMIHAHPSFSEAFFEACGEAMGGCIHLPPKN